MSKIISLVLVIALISGCNLLQVPKNESNPNVFMKTLWQEFDKYYALMDLKDVNWDSVKVDIESKDFSSLNDEQLFDTALSYLAIFQDPHLRLISPFKESTTISLDTPPLDKKRIIDFYLDSSTKAIYDDAFFQGTINDSIGYLYLGRFGGDMNTFNQAINTVMNKYENTPYLVVDIRNNSGGNSRNAEYFAGRFISSQKNYAKARSRNGSGHTNFTDWTMLAVSPSGSWQYKKSVFILIDDRCLSATEQFILALKDEPHITFIGDTTGGSVGNPKQRELPNGWIAHISSWHMVSMLHEEIEDVGIVPNILIEGDSTNDSTDTVLDFIVTKIDNEVRS